MRIRIGTRKSKLARAQTQLALDFIRAQMPAVQTEIVCISTDGDTDKKTPLHAMKKTGIFVKKIEEALLTHQIDIAIHSLKDVGSQGTSGLMLLPFALFEDRRDALITKNHQKLLELPPSALIATGSLRRMACIHAVRPDIRFIPIRGNIETRLKTFYEQGADGLVLAVAGLKRLGLEDQIDEYLEPEIVIPACGQGTLGLQIRQEDQARFQDLTVDSIQNKEVQIERKFLSLCQASCHVPVGCMAQIKHDYIQVDACLGETMENCAFVHEKYPLSLYDQVAQLVYQEIREKEL